MKYFFLLIAGIGVVAGIQELIELAHGYRMPLSLQYGYTVSCTFSLIITMFLLIVLTRKKP